MKEVFIVHYDYEIQCVAETYEDAINFLIKDGWGWINEDMVYDICEQKGMDKPEDTEKFVREMSRSKFNCFFSDYYFIEWKPVYKREG